MMKNHHSVKTNAVGLTEVALRTLRIPLSPEHIFAVWSCIEIKGETSIE